MRESCDLSLGFILVFSLRTPLLRLVLRANVFPQGGGVCQFKSGWSCLKVHQQEGCLGHFKSVFHRAHALFEFYRKKQALKRFPVIGAISPYMEKCLKSDGYSENQIVPIYNPVLVRKHAVLSLSNAPENLLVVASRLVSLKGIASLLLCLNHLRDLTWTCWIFGDGPQREELQALTAKLNLTQRVLFKGKRVRWIFKERSECKSFNPTQPRPRGLWNGGSRGFCVRGSRSCL